MHQAGCAFRTHPPSTGSQKLQSPGFLLEIDSTNQTPQAPHKLKTVTVTHTVTCEHSTVSSSTTQQRKSVRPHRAERLLNCQEMIVFLPKYFSFSDVNALSGNVLFPFKLAVLSARIEDSLLQPGTCPNVVRNGSVAAQKETKGQKKGLHALRNPTDFAAFCRQTNSASSAFRGFRFDAIQTTA